MKRILPGMMVLLTGSLLNAAAEEAPLTNIVVRLDPPDRGRQVVTITATPTATFTEELLEVECQYRQEFDWPPRGRKTFRRIIEPAVFVYRVKNHRFVDSLDTHISFFVPVDVKTLREAHGPTTFVTNVPVTISRVQVSALSNGVVRWSFQATPVVVSNDGVLR